MTTSSSIEPLTPEKRLASIQTAEKLHQAIVEWGAKRGLRAYRVITATDSFFEIFNPNTGKISHDFPEKIKASIAKYHAELKIYADETRSRDQKWANAGRSCVAGPSEAIKRRAPKRQGGQICDCNGETWSNSPIKSAIDSVGGIVGPCVGKASPDGHGACKALNVGAEVDLVA